MSLKSSYLVIVAFSRRCSWRGTRISVINIAMRTSSLKTDRVSFVYLLISSSQELNESSKLSILKLGFKILDKCMMDLVLTEVIYFWQSLLKDSKPFSVFSLRRNAEAESEHSNSRSHWRCVDIWTGSYLVSSRSFLKNFSVTSSVQCWSDVRSASYAGSSRRKCVLSLKTNSSKSSRRPENSLRGCSRGWNTSTTTL